MKILVTGSSGTIGSVVVAMLHNAGHTVIGVDSTIAAPWTHESCGMYVHYNVDIRNYEAMSAIISHWLPDAVIHLAGAKVGNPDYLMSVNAAATRQLFKLLTHQNCRTFVFANTSSKYTDVTHNCIDSSDERLATRHKKIPPYAISKLNAENFLKEWLNRSMYSDGTVYVSIPTAVSLNIFQLMDARTPATPTYLEQIEKAYSDNKPFEVYTHNNIPFMRSYVSVRDVAVAFVLAAQKNHGKGQYIDLDICADTPHTGVDIYLEFMYGAGIHPTSVIVDRGIDTFGPSFVNFSKDELIEKRLTPNLIGDNRKAYEVLKWKPRVGLRDIITHFKSQQ